MKPAEFWRLTFHEFNAYLRGRQKARRDELYTHAVQAWWLLSAWVKNPPKPERMMGESRDLMHLGSVSELRRYLASKHGA